MSKSRSPSPVEEEPQNQEEETAPEGSPLEKSTDTKDCDVLHIERLIHTQAYWTVDDRHTLIREITKTPKILDNIKFVVYVKPKHKEKQANSVNNGSFLVKFSNVYFCALAYSEWTAMEQQKNIKVSYDLDNLYEQKQQFKRPFLKSQPKIKAGPPPTKRQKVFQDSGNNDPAKNETYGLSMQFLSNLNIQLPIGNKLFITNIHPNVTIEKLREIFGFAGHVVHVVLQKQENHVPSRSYAKLQYDHPVEAVQAISMFNNQRLYSWILSVRMDSKPTNDIPEGLAGMGPGLGINGEPLRGIRNYIELQAIKQKLLLNDNDKKDSGGSSNMFNFSPFLQPDKSIFNQMASNSMGLQVPMVPQIPVPPVPVPTPMPMSIQAANQQNMNQFGQPTINPFNLQNMQMLQNPSNLQQAVNMLLQNKINSESMGQSSDQGGGSSSEWQAHPNQSDNYNQSNYSASDNKNSYGNNQNSDYGNRSYSSSSRYEDRDSRDSRKLSRDNERSSKEKSDMLLFKNLPRSVSLQALRNKMQEVGDVKFSEMTGQGRAIVRFTHSRDAERCIKLFNKSKVDGEVIDVRFF